MVLSEILVALGLLFLLLLILAPIFYYFNREKGVDEEAGDQPEQQDLTGEE